MTVALPFRAKIVAIAFVAMLCGCASIEDLKRAESRLSEAEHNETITRDQVGHLSSEVGRLRTEVAELRKIVTGSSRLEVTIVPDGWQLVYANSTGVSQNVRLTVKSGGSAESSLKVKAVNVPRSTTPGGPGLGEPGPQLGGAEWDMSAVGGQRWVRLACGFEIVGKATGAMYTVDVLVSSDQRPISCDQPSN